MRLSNAMTCMIMLLGCGMIMLPGCDGLKPLALRSSSHSMHSSDREHVESDVHVGQISFTDYLSNCQDSMPAFKALARVDQQNSTNYQAEREKYRYFRSTWCALKFAGGRAKTIVDVGSAFPPFLRSVDWIPERLVVSPYFPGDENPCGTEDSCTTWPGIAINVADFYRWRGGHSYDIVLCSQVLEHVDDPSTFLRKLLQTGSHIVVSVPYLWKDYHLQFHKSHYVSIRDVRRWAGKHERAYSVISEPSASTGFSRRVILLFDGDTR